MFKTLHWFIIATLLASCVSNSDLLTETTPLPANSFNPISPSPRPLIIESTAPPTVSALTPSQPPPELFSPSYTPTMDTRLTAKYWREWSVIPELSHYAKEILQLALRDFNLDPQRFSKIGDCQFTTDTFLAGYVKGIYTPPLGLEPTVSFFKDSMLQESITAENGFGISSVLNPMFGLSAGHTECKSNETPLDCELRIRRPSFVLIAMGTNWIPNAELSFDRYLRQVVERVLETGALPILSTKADNIEGDWRLNYVIAQIAYEYDLPLVNIWRSVQHLPNHGLESPENIYLTGDGWLAQNEAWLRTLDLIRLTIENQDSSK